MGLAACCGVLALPATATATHMSDMPWCPHSEVQGADPAAGLPGGSTGPASRAAPGGPPAGTVAGAPKATPAAGPAAAPRATAQPARAAQPAQVAQPAQAGQAQAGQAQVAQGAAAATLAVATPGATVAAPAQGGAVVPQVAAAQAAAAQRLARERARARAKARAEARAKARREARRLAHARLQAAELERNGRAATAAGLAAELTTPAGWTMPAVRTDDGLPALVAGLPALVAGLLAAFGLLGAAVLTALRRRRRTAAVPVPARAPVVAMSARELAIEAELQEIIAEARAARPPEHIG